MCVIFKHVFKSMYSYNTMLLSSSSSDGEEMQMNFKQFVSEDLRVRFPLATLCCLSAIVID